MSSRTSPAMIGSFVVSGIVLVVAAVIVFGSGRLFDSRARFVSFFPGSVNGLTVGSTVAFRGVNVGNVTEILLSMGDTVDFANSRVPVVFEVDESLIQSRGATVDLESGDAVRRLLDQGMSARLETESFLTGRLYIALDFRPDADLLTYGGEHPYPEVPTVASSLAEAQQRLRELADRIAQVDFEEVFAVVRSTLDGANEFVNDPELRDVSQNLNALMADLDRTSVAVRTLVETVDTTVGPMQTRLLETAERADSSIDEVEETMRTLQSVVHPDAPVVVGLVQTLEELERAAESLRRVAELVERDPSILIRGRAPGGGS